MASPSVATARPRDECLASNPKGVVAADAPKEALQAVGAENRAGLVFGDGSLWTLRAAIDVAPERENDGNYQLKFPWFRATPGWVDISGRRLDGDGAFSANSPTSGYSPTGFVPTVLFFSSPGCWEITGKLGTSMVTFRIFIDGG